MNVSRQVPNNYFEDQATKSHYNTINQSAYDEQVIPTLLRKRGTSAEKDANEEEDPFKTAEQPQPVDAGKEMT